MGSNAIFAETGYAREMRTRARAALLFGLLAGLFGLMIGACGGAAAPAVSEMESTGGEAPEDAPLPLEAYVSPAHDFVSIDLAQLMSHPLVAGWVEDALAAIEGSRLARELDLGEVLRRTAKLLVVASFDDASALAEEVAGWVFARGDYEGYSPLEPEHGSLDRRGDHTLILSQSGDPAEPGAGGGEPLDAAIVLRLDVGDSARSSLSGLPARGTVETARRVRLRVSLGDGVSLEARVEHVDESGARRSLDELERMLARVRPVLLLSPKALRTLAEKLALRVEGVAVVARLELTAQDLRDLDELATKLGLRERFLGGVDAQLAGQP